MATRKSHRLAAKQQRNSGELATYDGGDDREDGRRASVGGALGLTPARPKGQNLTIAKAASVAEAAAARLDELNAGDQQVKREKAKRKSSKARKARSKKQDEAEWSLAGAGAYVANSRESMALYENTRQMFDEDM